MMRSLFVWVDVRKVARPSVHPSINAGNAQPHTHNKSNREKKKKICQSSFHRRRREEAQNNNMSAATSSSSLDHHHQHQQVVIAENAKSVARRALPPIPPQHKADGTGTILLFYQYKEPEWTEKEHKVMIKRVIALGEKCDIQGRGRVAPEGLNCTLSGKPQCIRAFCEGLRSMDSLFLDTDFKLTDGVPPNKLFKSLSIRKTQELVAYGLAGEKAPSIKQFAGVHLEAVDYHKAMEEKDTVIIDVRNQYESAIGHFAPPPGGAELIDPLMRNSIEFPKWLADPQTKKKLHNKVSVLLQRGYCALHGANPLIDDHSESSYVLYRRHSL